MSNTRRTWPGATADATPWFDLGRHDEDPTTDPEANPADPETEPEAGSEGDPEPDEGLGDGGLKALQRERAAKTQAKKDAADARRVAAAAQRKVQEYEDRDRSELEKAQAKSAQDATRAEAATKRAVLAEVKALAADLFEDPDDARVNLADRLAAYADDEGDIDIEAIEADLGDILERKPHLRKATATASAEKPRPKPDPAQGSKGPTTPVDYRTAPRGELDKELAATYGYRLRS